MPLKSSFYNHYAATGDGSAIVFNRYWGSVAVFDAADASALEAGTLVRLDASTLASMEDAGFVVDAATNEIDVAHEQYLRRKATNSVFNLTMEMTQACNLACPFCYQNSYRDDTPITDGGLDNVLRYMTSVLEEQKRPFTDVVFRTIGGEPLMQKAKVLDGVTRGAEIAKRFGVNFHPQIDTNGLLVDESVVRAMRSISITLTNKADHDKSRIRHNGSGTYDTILKILGKLAPVFNDHQTILSIRYNANAFNAKYAAEVYKMIKGLGITHTEFELHNTVQYGYNALAGSMSGDDFKRLYMEIIALKVQHGEVVTDFPRPTFSPCSAYTPFNVKFTATGQLAACDAMHTARGSADELVADIDKHGEIFHEVASHDPFLHPQCGGCPNVGICGGMLFCKTNENVPDNNPCDFLPFDLDEFLRFFVKHYPDNPSLFDLGPEPAVNA
ncbi:radical SAM protein [Actinokineospora enzanensis]|uniref:radical SAM protein n=1 Tax=Actinokineospora enzanensis TaxID=155975 RepID=UPI00037B4AF2|nr:radical SAM protein [Actinokineospora enzanensis]